MRIILFIDPVVEFPHIDILQKFFPAIGFLSYTITQNWNQATVARIVNTNQGVDRLLTN